MRHRKIHIGLGERLPEHQRSLDLFRQGYPLDLARAVALGELEQQQRNDIDERPSKPPVGRLVGAERNG